ncbi:hypothetical protein NVE80_20630 [Escherichia coli]|nr:hypothetical protein [Escherichia coli]
MSIANCAIGPLYDEQIKKTLMYADHKFKRLMNTRMSLLEHLSPHYDLSSMFSYELEGRVFRIKLIKPEIKLSRQQLIFSVFYLAKREKSSQYKYIEKEYLLGQLLIFLMYKTVYYSIHSIRVSRKHFYNDIKPKLVTLKKESLLSTNFMKNRREISGEVFGDVGSIEADFREISTLIHRRKALFISF